MGSLEIDWSKVNVTFKGRVITLPKLITIKLWDKFKVRHMMGNQLILFHLMLKQGFNWFTLAQEEQEIEKILIKSIFYRKWQDKINPVYNFIFGSIHMSLPMDTVDVELTIRMVKGIYTYCKDHTMESTIFSPWSKTVIPFPSLR